VGLRRVYTKTGDQGETGLVTGERVRKTDLRIAAGGAIDEASSAIGLARALSINSRVRATLLEVQQELMVVGSEVSGGGSTGRQDVKPDRITQENTTRLEREMDALATETELPPGLIVPGGSPAAAAIDLARATVRRAELAVVALSENGLLAGSEVPVYLNRLSDLLFVVARYEQNEDSGPSSD
jgi:cob(I)alamin adenosyltransferase